jgi:hypothetical protein
MLAATLAACSAPASPPSGDPVDPPFATMTLGTCFDTGDGTLESLVFDAVTTPADCADPHDFEYLGVVDYRDAPESEFGRIGTEECIAQYAEYVGAPYDPAGYYNLVLIMPEREDIEAGQTDGYCLIAALEGADRGVVGSAEDTRGIEP